MIMVPSQNGKEAINRSASNYAFCCDTKSAMNQVEVVEGYYYNCLGSDNNFVVRRHMAEEDESRAHTVTHNNNNEAETKAEGGSGSTSKEEEARNNNNNNNNSSSNWLQLSIGSCHQSHDAAASSVVTTTKHHRYHHDHQHHQMAPITGSGLVELDLLPGNRSSHLNWPSSSFSRQSMEAPAMFPVRSFQGGSTFGGSSLLFEQSSSMSMSMAMSSGGPLTPFSAQAFGFHQQQQQQQHQPQEMMNWAFGPLPHSMAIMPSNTFTSFSSSSLQPCSSLRPFSSSTTNPPLGSYFPTPFHHFPSSSSSSGYDQFDHVAGPSSSDVTTVRVVDPPRRPHSGLWFILQASQNQARQPFLPQIPKSYLRIKDGRMTVRLLLKYLVSKLRLESESEIEITCRGQQLLPFLTLQHVRDNIWTPRDTTRNALLSDSSTTDHVMVLHYGRSSTS